MRLFLAALICLVSWNSGGFGGANAESLAPIPALHARVTDAAGALSPADESRLESRLAAIERAKGAQIAVLIVDTTAPEAVEQYAFRAAEQWKLGRKAVDDGVLILLAMKDRAYRMEVGYGLEGAIPDVTAKRILDDVMRPYLRSGDVAGGLIAAVDAVEKILAGEALPEPVSRNRPGPDAVIPVLAGGLILTAILTGTGIMARTPAAAASAFLAFLFGILLADLVVGFVVSMFVFILGAFADSTGRYSTGGRYGSGGWSSGGGGFSGGGGSFGGGGASGRW